MMLQRHTYNMLQWQTCTPLTQRHPQTHDDNTITPRCRHHPPALRHRRLLVCASGSAASKWHRVGTCSGLGTGLHSPCREMTYCPHMLNRSPWAIVGPLAASFAAVCTLTPEMPRSMPIPAASHLQPCTVSSSPTNARLPTTASRAHASRPTRVPTGVPVTS